LQCCGSGSGKNWSRSDFFKIKELPEYGTV
jgi:hypothetical protein